MPVMNWKKIKDAEIYGRGSYLLPDQKYNLEILKCFTKQTRDNGPAFIVDFIVKGSSTDEIKPGTKKNWFQSMKDENMAFSSIKEFMINVLQVDTSDLDEYEQFCEKLPDLMELVSDEEWETKKAEDHPLHGKTVGVETELTITKKNNKEFTRHTWKFWDGEDPEEFSF